MELKPGWLNRQFDQVSKNVDSWPDWMKRAAGFDNEASSSTSVLTLPEKPLESRKKMFEAQVQSGERWNNYPLSRLHDLFMFLYQRHNFPNLLQAGLQPSQRHEQFRYFVVGYHYWIGLTPPASITFSSPFTRPRFPLASSHV